MLSPDHSVDEARETAALYALGAMDADGARAFEAHLDGGCDLCRAETAAFTNVTAELAHAAQPQLPPPALRTRLLETIAAASDLEQSTVIDRDGVRFVRSAQLPWEAAKAPAVEVKLLSVDRERGYATKLVRMAPGAALYPHRHADVEESYVIEGDLLVGGVLMHTGDYCRAEPGSIHADVTTRGGCLFIAVCSLRDQVLARA